MDTTFPTLPTVFALRMSKQDQSWWQEYPHDPVLEADFESPMNQLENSLVTMVASEDTLEIQNQVLGPDHVDIEDIDRRGWAANLIDGSLMTL